MHLFTPYKKEIDYHKDQKIVCNILLQKKKEKGRLKNQNINK